MNPNVEIPPEKVESPAVIVISRVTFNYAVIAFVCLALGMVIGMVAYDRVAQGSQAGTEALINKAVATAVASLPQAAVNDPNARHNVSIDDRPSLGPKDAPVVLVEFGDFDCIHCKDFHDSTIEPLLQHYGDKVLYVFRDFPILGQGSVEAALAADCAYDQNAFWGFHDMLYADQANLTRTQFVKDAQTLKLNVDQFTQCFDSGEHQDRVGKDYTDAEALGVNGTPTFFVNGKMLVGAQPYQAFADAIDAELDVSNVAATQPPS
ncbi:MAG TPA: thioredoxin domain-containing protein [Phototrophicaceae bacterium]|nr:thioredoxin domain-containing protein [Phototrophicaceae bacterium]